MSKEHQTATGTALNGTAVRSEGEGALRKVVLENAMLRVTILPGLGGKIASLVNLRTGREFLLQPPERPYRPASYGDSFDQYDTSGFDECFPTVSECEVDGVMLPDHGEIWSAAWKCEVAGDRANLEAPGVKLPYMFRKTLRLEDATLAIDYEVSNLDGGTMQVLWSAHPLLKVEARAELILPGEVREVLIDSSADGRLGSPGETCGWPKAKDKRGNEVRLDRLEGVHLRTADKLYTSRLKTGAAALWFPATREALVFRFDAKLVPYLGMWICQGGWPAGGRGHFTVALEPCSGRPDSLATAVETGECDRIPTKGRKRWTVELKVEQGSRPKF